MTVYTGSRPAPMNPLEAFAARAHHTDMPALRCATWSMLSWVRGQRSHMDPEVASSCSWSVHDAGSLTWKRFHPSFMARSSKTMAS